MSAHDFAHVAHWNVSLPLAFALFRAQITTRAYIDPHCFVMSWGVHTIAKLLRFPNRLNVYVQAKGHSA